MNLKKLFCLTLVTVMTAGCLFALGGCNNSGSPSTGSTDPTNADGLPSVNEKVKHDTEHEIGYQLEKPATGDEIAVIHTSMGDITVRLFPENAPKAVESFKTLAKEDKYNDTIFHRVIDDFMIQGGDYENFNGTGGTSSFGSAFEDEFCDTLYNIRGSLAMANSGADTNGSQFFINQSSAENFSRDNIPDYETARKNYESYYNQYAAAYGINFLSTYPDVDSFINANGGISPLKHAITEDVWKLYEENGGNIHLDGALRASGGHTVFGQVIDGMDVVDAIAAVKVDDNNKPVEDVKVTSIEITTYNGN